MIVELLKAARELRGDKKVNYDVGLCGNLYDRVVKTDEDCLNFRSAIYDLIDIAVKDWPKHSGISGCPITKKIGVEQWDDPERWELLDYLIEQLEKLQ